MVKWLNTRGARLANPRMSLPAPGPSCACPRTDAGDCMRVRYARYLITASPYESPYGDDQECECGCHDGTDTSDEDNE